MFDPERQPIPVRRPSGYISLTKTLPAIFLFAVCIGGDIFFPNRIFIFFYIYFAFLSLIFLILLKRTHTFEGSYAILPLIFYLGLCFLSLSWSVRLKDAEIVIVSLFTGLLTYFIFPNVIQEEDDIYFFLRIIVTATSLNALVGIFQGTVGGSLFILFGSAAQGTTYHPNFFSGLLNLAYPLGILLLVKEEKDRWLLPLFLILLGNHWSLSRGGSLTILLISLASLLFLFIKGYKKTAIKILFLILLSLLVFFPFTFFESKSPTLINKLTSESLLSTSIRRLEIWQGTLPIILHHPFLGTGLRSFEDQFKMFKNPPVPKFHSNAHNLLLHFASEVGFIGLLFFLGFCFLTLCSYIKIYKYAERLPFKATSFFLLLAISSFLFQNLSEYKWEHPLFQVLFYFTASLAFSMKRFSNPGRKDISFTLTKSHKMTLSGLLILFGVFYVGNPWIGNYFLSRGKHLLPNEEEKGFRNILKASFFDPSNPEPYLLMSQIFRKAWFETQDRIFLEKAIEARQKAIALLPMNADFYLDLGRFLEEVKRWDEAKRYYEKALEIHPHSPKYKEELAVFLARRGETDKAILLWENLKDLLQKFDPEGLNLMRVHLHLGRAYKKRGDLELSKRYFNQVIHFPEKAIKEGMESAYRSNFNSYKKIAIEELGN